MQNFRRDLLRALNVDGREERRRETIEIPIDTFCAKTMMIQGTIYK
jgi:hypothetical protein